MDREGAEKPADEARSRATLSGELGRALEQAARERKQLEKRLSAAASSTRDEHKRQIIGATISSIFAVAMFGGGVCALVYESPTVAAICMVASSAGFFGAYAAVVKGSATRALERVVTHALGVLKGVVVVGKSSEPISPGDDEDQTTTESESGSDQ